ncbi:MAG TPA: hypothetical protein DEP66_02815 [Acidimicrobiaceae bacterium]|nr:hypothetical protein [Acidimicrobiaceae bacterium]
MRRPRGAGALAAAVAAIALLASVLAVSPAGAANTAAESLVDHDQNAATADRRPFAGADRYATALAAARWFVDSANQSGSVESVVIASGESLVDAAAAAGLASTKNAPVLLTRANRLPSAVARFLDDEYIREVFVVGGESVVGAGVVEDLRAVPSVETVLRLAGPDRYTTAARISDLVVDPGEYCSTGQIGAILVNADSSFADVVAAGPLAFALELPILLTTSDTLPADAADYLANREVAHVVVVGGTSVVGRPVVDAVRAAGVSDVTRIDGANRFETAVAVARTIADCGDAAVLSTTTAALVNGYSPADGVTSAPLLGQGLAGDGVTPLLLVTASGLPAATRAWLAATPTETAAGEFSHLRVTAIGGTAAVPALVMDAALDAAVTSKAITAKIKAAFGATKATVRFSAPVDSRSAGTAAGSGPPATSAVNTANYRIGGAPLLLGDTVVYDPDTRTATVTVADEGILGDGVEIALVGGAVSGVGTDNRRVEAASLTLAKPKPDRVRPRIDVFAPENAYEFALSVVEPSIVTDLADDLSDIELNGAPLRDTYTSAAFLTRHDNAVARVVCLYGEAGSRCLSAAGQDAPAALSTGDTISIVSGAVVDASGNQSRTVKARVGANREHPEVASATLSEPAVRNLGDDENPEFVVAQWAWESAAAPGSGFFYEDASDQQARSATLSRAYAGDATPSGIFLYFGPVVELAPASRPGVEGSAGGASRPSVVLDADGTPDGCAVRGLSSPPVFSETVNAVAVEHIRVTPPFPRPGPSDTQLLVCINAEATAADVVAAVNGASVVAVSRSFFGVSTTEGSRQNARAVVAYLASDFISPQVSMKIVASADGIAGGALGNDWGVLFSDLGAAADADVVPDVSVDVGERRRVIRVGFDDGATPGEVFDALVDDETFGRDFTAEIVATKAQRADPALLAGFVGRVLRLSGGESQVTLTLRFDDILRDFHAGYFADNNIDRAQSYRKLNLIARAGGGTLTSSVGPDTTADPRADLSLLGDPAADGADFALQFRSTPTDIVIVYTYNRSSDTPKPGNVVVIPRGTAVGYAAALGEDCGAPRVSEIPPAGGADIPAGCRDWQTVETRRR